MPPIEATAETMRDLCTEIIDVQGNTLGRLETIVGEGSLNDAKLMDPVVTIDKLWTALRTIKSNTRRINDQVARIQEQL